MYIYTCIYVYIYICIYIYIYAIKYAMKPIKKANLIQFDLV